VKAALAAFEPRGENISGPPLNSMNTD
jgi:hypothetical protein